MAPVVPMPQRPAAHQVPEPQVSEREVLIASAASNGGLHAVAFEADGVERRSSSAAIRSRPLDLELTSA